MSLNSVGLTTCQDTSVFSSYTVLLTFTEIFEIFLDFCNAIFKQQFFRQFVVHKKGWKSRNTRLEECGG